MVELKIVEKLKALPSLTLLAGIIHATLWAVPAIYFGIPWLWAGVASTALSFTGILVRDGEAPVLTKEDRGQNPRRLHEWFGATVNEYPRGSLVLLPLLLLEFAAEWVHCYVERIHVIKVAATAVLIIGIVTLWKDANERRAQDLEDTRALANSGGWERGSLARVALERMARWGQLMSHLTLASAQLDGVVLPDADFPDADLSDADLSDADLRGANLRWANLTNAHFSGAHLNGTNFTGATGRPASDWDEAHCWDEETVWPDGYVPPEPVREHDRADEEDG